MTHMLKFQSSDQCFITTKLSVETQAFDHSHVRIQNFLESQLPAFKKVAFQLLELCKQLNT